MIVINDKKKINKDEFISILEKMGLAEKFKTAQTISIKPNFTAGSYLSANSHAVTDLSLLSQIANHITEFNQKATVFIGESDSTGYGFAYLKFKNLCLPEILQIPEESKKRVIMLDLSRDKLLRFDDNRFQYFNSIDKQLWISKQFMESDIKISISNIKTHSVTKFTGACKNLFGCLPATEKSVYHPYIHKVVHDLTIAINPDLSIVDGFYGMERNGPIQGEPVKGDFRVFSDNAVEADIYSCEAIGINSKDVIYLKTLLRTSSINKASDIQYIEKYKKPQLFLRIMNTIGIFIQRIGQAISNFGHRVHMSNNSVVLSIAILRPLLLKFFDYENLRKLKRKVMK